MPLGPSSANVAQSLWLASVSDPSVIKHFGSPMTGPPTAPGPCMQHPGRAGSGGEESPFWPSPTLCQVHRSCSKLKPLFLPAQHQCLLVRPEPKCFNKSLPSVSETYWRGNEALERGWVWLLPWKAYSIGVWLAVEFCSRSGSQHL